MKAPKILDNKRNGKVIDELKENLRKGSKLSVISAYFTIYAYAELKKDRELIREYYIEHHNEKKVSGNEFEIKLRNEMKQSAIAKECADWMKEKVEIKSLKQSNSAQPRLIYIENYGENRYLFNETTI